MMCRSGFLCPVFGLVLVTAMAAAPAEAEDKINCANEYRSGKLYFSQELYQKAVDRFALAVEICPEKWDYNARYAMALAQYGGIIIDETVIVPGESDSTAATIARVEDMFRLAGKHFQDAWDADDGKKARKFVRENREHYWVDRYNSGVRLLEDEKNNYADIMFRLARLIDPSRAKAYSQGAIALIKLEKKAEAAELVKTGLEQAPDDEKLNSLLETIYIDAATDLIEKAETDNDPKPAREAIEFIDQVLERRGGEDPELIFKKGVARQVEGSATEKTEDGAGAADAVVLFKLSAGHFARVAELVPYEENAELHLAALFNEVQSLLRAGNDAETIEIIKHYLALNTTDPVIWQTWAICLSQAEDTENAVAALMVYKSLNAGETGKISVEDAVANAQNDAKSALDELGQPDFVYGYQEAQSGNQIETWFWPEKRTVMSFILGVKNGEMHW